ncbi:crossover junction endodeoxyribonuclease RuvC [Raineyella fluvialis]|uniref:Crossover junction endodeoxyribonuclease RuvC n=1 Tax=Raineyella fluvialis TaxID=2662261 RepID=A0A5Q2FCL3_9ACTN|nr:crossover junction endodeoxyribonuclease RuvC [Raineyella fluvialis]QGF24508.1 crossover junction endodeoxyribonuclease RuvC [Raineyella fluvialis]
MRVLGIDPGLTRCGFGVIDGDRSRRCTLVDVGVFRTPADLDTPRRLVLLEQEIEAKLREHRPDVVAVEQVFAQHNSPTVMGTAQAAGVAMLVGARHGLPVRLHTPSEVKAAVTGSGRADKQQVGTMVSRILGLAEMPRPADAADAVALAVCHLWRTGLEGTAAAAGAATAPNRWQQAIDAHRGDQHPNWKEAR